MKINERFYSIQGEGYFSGLPCYFMRTAGCSIKCNWCDTKKAWDKNLGEDLSINEILEKIGEKKKYVSITGGNPFEQEDLYELAEGLSNHKNVDNVIIRVAKIQTTAMPSTK